jgi:hypothetical protein
LFTFRNRLPLQQYDALTGSTTKAAPDLSDKQPSSKPKPAPEAAQPAFTMPSFSLPSFKVWHSSPTAPQRSQYLPACTLPKQSGRGCSYLLHVCILLQRDSCACKLTHHPTPSALRPSPFL